MLAYIPAITSTEFRQYSVDREYEIGAEVPELLDGQIESPERPKEAGIEECSLCSFKTAAEARPSPLTPTCLPMIRSMYPYFQLNQIISRFL